MLQPSLSYNRVDMAVNRVGTRLNYSIIIQIIRSANWQGRHVGRMPGGICQRSPTQAARRCLKGQEDLGYYPE